MKPLALLLALCALAAPGLAQEGDDPVAAHDHAAHAAHAAHADQVDGARDPLRAAPWDPAALEHFRTLPVQEGGRVKPFETQVSFLLLRLAGRRAVDVPADPARFGAAAGTRLDPVEWALDTLFFPGQAAHYPVFQVQTHDVIHALGLETEGKRKRDRYSYAELLPGQERLMALTQRYMAVDEKERSALQAQVVALGMNVFHYRLFTQALGFAGLRLALHDPDVAAHFGGAERVGLAEVLDRAPELEQRVRTLRGLAAPDAGQRAELSALEGLRLTSARMAGESRFLAWLPPVDGAEAWLSLPDLVQRVLAEPDGADHAAQVGVVAAMQRLAETRADPAAFAAQSAVLHERLSSLAEARGEYDGIELEVALYEADPFFRALLLYLLAFVVAAAAWLRPALRWPWRVSAGITIAASALLVGGIVVRCVLRGRPPVTTLYETVLFVTAVLVITALVMEAINRRRVALSVGALLGAVGMFLAGSYERMDGQDTMPTLVAVLDTNFWLATHVTTVTMGYAAGLLAGALAHVYLFGKLFGLRRADPTFYRNLARMVYGVVCFTVLFSVVGTILGGVWANESWGRFWGWDPKENGALMIVLWNLAILHGRAGGLIRDFGLCLMAVFGNIVVAFSWWGVNLLGVGLHSYGFTGGVQRALHVFYAVEAGVVLLGGVAWLLAARAPAERVEPARPAEQGASRASGA